MLADEPRDHLLNAADDVVRLEQLRRGHLLPPERQQLAREGRRPARGTEQLVQVGSPLRSRGELARQELPIVRDHREQVVEVVRDTAGQLPDCFELL